MLLLLAVKSLPQILLIPIVVCLITSLIPPWTFATSTAITAITTTIATLLCKEQSFWSEPNLSLDCSLHFGELGDDLIRHGIICDFSVHHQLQENFPLVILWTPSQGVEHVFLLTQLGDCLAIHIGVGSIGVSGRWPCTEIVVLNFPITW